MVLSLLQHEGHYTRLRRHHCGVDPCHYREAARRHVLPRPSQCIMLAIRGPTRAKWRKAIDLPSVWCTVIHPHPSRCQQARKPAANHQHCRPKTKSTSRKANQAHSRLQSECSRSIREVRRSASWGSVWSSHPAVEPLIGLSAYRASHGPEKSRPNRSYSSSAWLTFLFWKQKSFASSPRRRRRKSRASGAYLQCWSGRYTTAWEWAQRWFASTENPC